MTVDISHQWGADLDVGPTGDLAMISPPTESSQRILRRLLTNLGDYIWNLDYGAGLAAFVGRNIDNSHIQAVVKSQMAEETWVARFPEPTVDIIEPADIQLGVFLINVSYFGSASGQIERVILPVTVP